ncbi:MAG: raffinose/stachyose/melibiose transport system permease protein [Solirubrobacteraceae bacterium]|nr:raffinose/stachyose/melibiose transport system permease protein [Solirubrobacteraceae bacterium]
MAFKGEFTRDWGLTSAAGMIIVLPVVLLFLALQRRFIAGLTAGGLKG